MRSSNWFQGLACGPLPDVARPPDMYTTDLDEEFLGPEREMEIEDEEWWKDEWSDED